MPKLILNMEVKDWDQFKKIYIEENNSEREKVGIKTIFIGQEMCKDNKVYALFDMPTNNSMREFSNKPETQKMVNEAGIILETLDGVVVR